jgi:25S rRNA (uracil2634-N3)-methyltransferase
MLLLGFLKAVAPLLAPGVPPSVHPRKPPRPAEDTDDSDTGDVDDELVTNRRTGPPTRGTVLITLRNVPPYTLW